MDEIEAVCPIYLVTSVEPCWKCKQPQDVVSVAVRDFTCDGEKVAEDGEPCFLINIESMPDAVYEFMTSRNSKYRKHYSKTADLTYFANTCSCGANFGDFYLYSEPDGAFFPTTGDAAERIRIEEMPFRGSLHFVASHGTVPTSIRFAT